MVIETVFRSEDLPAADRFSCWRERLGGTHAPVELHSDYAADYQAYQRILELGAVQVWPTTYQPLRYSRTAKLIRQSDPEQYHIALPLRGTNRVTRADQESTYGPYDCMFTTARSPLNFTRPATEDFSQEWG
jgi:hypothetical protein